MGGIQYKHYYFDSFFSGIEFAAYMEQIAYEAWTNFTQKEEDSMRSDYWEYYDRDFHNNGYLSVGKKFISLDGLSQPKTDNPIARLDKFNNRKFQSFIYDLRKQIVRNETNGLTD